MAVSGEMAADSTTAKAVFTVGHSNHPLEGFVALLLQHGVAALADVRSVPHSRRYPHFNRAALAAALETRGIGYVFLGRELGGRTRDPALYEHGRVSYERILRTEQFRAGIGRVLRGAARHTIVLMCAEREPLDCHRTLLVARALDLRGLEILHIHADGRLERHADAMDRLVEKFGLHAEGDLFRGPSSRAELVAEAMARQARKVAYSDRSMDAGQRRQDAGDA